MKITRPNLSVLKHVLQDIRLILKELPLSKKGGTQGGFVTFECFFNGEIQFVRSKLHE